MKVILLIDDNKLGKRNTVKEVANGYARNVLIPKGIAEPATPENVNKLNNRIAKEKHEYDIAKAKAEKDAENLKIISEVKIPVKCAKNGKMFGAVTNQDITEALQLFDISVKKQDIKLPIIKDLGVYVATIKLFSGISVDINIKVVNAEV